MNSKGIINTLIELNKGVDRIIFCIMGIMIGSKIVYISLT